MADRKKIAAVITSYFPRSHADVIVTKFLKGFPTDDGLLAPEVDVVVDVSGSGAFWRRYRVRDCRGIRCADVREY